MGEQGERQVERCSQCSYLVPSKSFHLKQCVSVMMGEQERQVERCSKCSYLGPSTSFHLKQCVLYHDIISMYCFYVGTSSFLNSLREESRAVAIPTAGPKDKLSKNLQLSPVNFTYVGINR